MSLEQLQAKIEKDYPEGIRLQGVKRKRTESLQKFLIKFLTKWNEEKDTIFIDSRELQTEPKRRRSLGDIFMLCKYYYPDVTLEEVVKELYVHLPECFEKGYRSSWCHAMLKRTFYYSETLPNQVYNKTHKDEYGHLYKYYLGFVAEKKKCSDCRRIWKNCECNVD